MALETRLIKFTVLRNVTPYSLAGEWAVISKSLIILIRRQLRPLYLYLAPLSKCLHQITRAAPRLNPETSPVTPFTSVRDTRCIFTHRKNKLVTDSRDQSVIRNVNQFQQSTFPVGVKKKKFRNATMSGLGIAIHSLPVHS